MSFAQELKDFAGSFVTGYNMVKSPEEKEAEKAKTRYTTASADAMEFGLQQDKELAPLRKQAIEVDIASARSGIASNQSLNAKRAFDMQQEKELAPLKRQEMAVGVEATRARIDASRAETEALTIENNKAKERKELLKGILQRKTGKPSAPPAPKPTSALPVDGTAPQALRGGAGSNTLMGSARDAVKSGLLHNVQLFQIGDDAALPAGGNEQAQYAYLSGDGGEDPQYLEPTQQIIKETAEEDGEELTPAELNLYTLAATYELYLAEGEPEKAQKVAGAILQSYRMKAGQWAAVAKAASSKGDIDGATMAIAKAYSFIPDGYDVSFSKDEKTGKIIVERKDIESGEVVSSELKHPREIFAMAMEVDPSVFDKSLMQAAGEAQAKVEPVRASDIEHIQTAASSAVDTVMMAIMPEGEALPPELSTRLTSATGGILQANLAKGIYPPAEDVARVAWEMTVVDPEAPDVMQFGVTEAEGGVIANFVDGTEMFIPAQQFRQLMTVRQKNAADAQKELDAADEAAKAAAKRNADFTASISAARGALTGTDGSETVFDGTP